MKNKSFTQLTTYSAATIACTALLGFSGCAFTEGAHQKSTEGNAEAIVTVLQRIESKCRGTYMGIDKLSVVDQSAPATGDAPLKCEGITRPVIDAIRNGEIEIRTKGLPKALTAMFSPPENNWLTKHKAIIMVQNTSLENEWEEAVLLHEALHARQWMVGGDHFVPHSDIRDFEGDAHVVEAHYYKNFVKNYNGISESMQERADSLKRAIAHETKEAQRQAIVAILEDHYGDLDRNNRIYQASFSLLDGFAPYTGKSLSEKQNKELLEAIQVVTEDLETDAAAFLAKYTPADDGTVEAGWNHTVWVGIGHMVLQAIYEHPDLTFLKESQEIYKSQDYQRKIDEVNQKNGTHLVSRTLHGLHLAYVMQQYL